MAARPDRGNGGKYLLLPPGYKGTVPADYFVYRPLTNNVFVFWRAFFTDPSFRDLDSRAAYFTNYYAVSPG